MSSSCNRSSNLEQYRLDRGYTEFSILAVGSGLRTADRICSVCGESLDQDTAGNKKQFVIGHSGLGGSGRQITTVFKVMAHLCRECDTSGHQLQDYIQFDLTGLTQPQLVVQVGNDKVARIWRVVLEAYEKHVKETITRSYHGDAVPKIILQVTSLSEKHYSLETPDWRDPLANTPYAVIDKKWWQVWK